MLPRRTICCSFCPSWSVNLRTRTGSATTPPAVGRTSPHIQPPGPPTRRTYAITTLATTVETWWPEILAFLHTGITNAGSEGTNRVIKTIARDAYCFRNPGNQRLRTRCATTRGCLDRQFR
ncbi:transposase [Streptomyces sp. NPDC096152]|uniref:transposase n=1 Tax=Streptomyces sp. NPDC096152 TaxID=3366078 RepID=UPI00381425D3